MRIRFSVFCFRDFTHLLFVVGSNAPKPQNCERRGGGRVKVWAELLGSFVQCAVQVWNHL